MTDELFERYKDALRAGHVAVLRGRLDDALAAYRHAEEIAPGRALPHTSIGGVLLDLGGADEALDELRVALELAPRDEGALMGRAEALVRAGRRAEAAADLDLLAEVQIEAGRDADAMETLQRALGLEERIGRRRHYQRALRSLRMASGSRVSDDAMQRARPTLEAGAAAGEGGAVPATTDDVVPPGDAAEAVAEGGAVEEAPEEVPAPVPAEPRLVGDALVVEAEQAVALGDAIAALEAYSEAARVFDEGGLPIAALDACREALALAPGDVGVHLRYASIYRSKGWREIAAIRLVSILRLVDLAEDAEGRARICAVIAASYSDDERLMALCA